MSDTYIQGRIIGELVRSILAAGYAVDVNDNDADRETHLAASTDYAAIMAAIFNPELDSADYTLDVLTTKGSHAGSHIGWVRLIDGNGTTVISDYTVNLEEVLKPANALADLIDRAPEKWMQKELAARDDLFAALKMARAYMDVCLGAPQWTGENPYPVMDAALAKAGEA